jgi:hypothetical protein
LLDVEPSDFPSTAEAIEPEVSKPSDSLAKFLDVTP